jgi:hypothetical protein
VAVLSLFSYALARVLVQALQDGKLVLLSYFFVLREIREIRTNLYSTGFRKHHMEEGGRFHSFFDNFYHIDSRGFAYLKGAGFFEERGLSAPVVRLCSLWIHV